MKIALDFGNKDWKWYSPSTGLFDFDRHAIVELTEAKWNEVNGRNRAIKKGFIRVNGTPYVVGDAARKYLIAERPRGASRYRKDYYGVGLAYALSEALQESDNNVTLIATHAPIDAEYAKRLAAAAKGEWRVESRFGSLEFLVTQVHTADEPIAGFCNVAFTKQGTIRKRKNPIVGQPSLTVDAGGWTIDVVAVEEDCTIDGLSLKSTRQGVIHAIESFQEQLRSKNALLFMDTGDIDIRLIEKAMMTGTFQFGKLNIECSRIADEILNSLVNDVVQIINAAGGVANFPIIIITGGGGGLIYERLQKALPRAQFILAVDEDQIDNIRFANAFGAAKLLALLEKEAV